MNSEYPASAIEGLKKKPWNDATLVLPSEIRAVPGMLSYQEKRMLYYLALRYYSGWGTIADMGAYLGGSTICFAVPLKERGFTQRLIHSYDLFKLSPFELQRDFADNPPQDLKTRDIFDRHLAGYHNLLSVHEGDVLRFPWENGPIELLFVGVAKSYKVFDHIVLNYFPSLVPLKSLLILQDYIWKSNGPWHHVVMEKLSDFFEYVVDTDINSVVFLPKAKIPEEVLRQCQWELIPFEEKVALMDKAIGRLDTESKREHLRQVQQILLRGQDMTWGMNYERL